MASRRKTPSLYPKNTSPKLDLKLFKNPTAEYRGTPFWSWNDKLDLPQLMRQIDQMAEMGFGGFHVHSRTGLADEYLGKQYTHALVESTKRAAKKKMLSWLYDEDRWPSGAAGGIVTKDKQHRIKHLLWTTTPYRTDGTKPPVQDRNSGTRSENGVLLASYEVTLKDGYLANYRRLDKSSRSVNGNPRIWHAYLESPQDSVWFNGQTYVDTLSRPAIQKFIQVTHEKLRSHLGEYFGSVIPSIFCDEPQFTKKTTFNKASDTSDQFMPWTMNFADTFKSTFNFDILNHLPELFWNLPDNAPSGPRWCYHEHTAERFAEAFSDTIGSWCETNGIAFTGHMLGEVNLAGQTRGIGEAMRPLRSFHIPGIDILCDRMEFTTAKQAQSVARQYGRPGVLSELYGVTNWDYDFIGHKAQGDWQAAMGVTVRVPHLTWQSMRGEAKRDYPASIGYQSPWYKEYPLIENHFARLNTVLTRGKPVVKVAVIHPVESYWLSVGPLEHNQSAMEDQERNFENITTWLVKSQIDFDFISEALLPDLCPKQTGKTLNVGAMSYDVVILPSLRTIRTSTLQRLKAFADASGKVIFAGDIPKLVSLNPSNAPASLAKRSTVIPFERRAILNALKSYRNITVTHEDGSPADSVMYQMREDGTKRNLFLVNLDRERQRENLKIALNGKWKAQLLNTMSGSVEDIAVQSIKVGTTITLSLTAHGHALISLAPGTSKVATTKSASRWKSVRQLNDPVLVTLSEPNVLLLDQAQWRINGGKWNAREEILRIDTAVRQQLKLPSRSGRAIQPWADVDPAPVVATLELKFHINSSVAIRKPQLALEDARTMQVFFNGKPIKTIPDGWWVDEAIDTIPLPSFGAGKHELIIKIPMTRKTNIEWMYLLGDFGVRVAGRSAKIIEPVRALSFGDWTHQGLPFYSGNVTYHCKVDQAIGDACVEIPRFKSPLLSIDLDGKNKGQIAFSPFRLELGALKRNQSMDITAYGNRVNAFGPVHNAIADMKWIGPGAWRHTGNAWAYEYQLKRMGILVAPTLLARDA